MAMWDSEDVYPQLPIPLGDKMNAISRAYVEMDKVVHGPEYPLAIQYPMESEIQIHFVEEGHKYTVTYRGQEIPCTSVTTFAHSLFPHFDSYDVALNKMRNTRSLPRYEYYHRMLDFIVSYIRRALFHPSHRPFDEHTQVQVRAFVQEAAESEHPVRWPSAKALMKALHRDTGLAVPDSIEEYTAENLRAFLKVWVTQGWGDDRARIVCNFWINTLRFMWFRNGGVASTLGTYMHENIEFQMNGAPHELTSREARLHLEFDVQLERTTRRIKYQSEKTVADPEMQIVGTIDALYCDKDNHDNLYIYDWKRCKALTKPEDIYWERRYGTVPLTAMLEDCNFNHYSIQLNTYKTILERNYGKRVLGMYLVVLHPQQEAPIVQEVYTRPTFSAEIVAHRLATIPASMRVSIPGKEQHKRQRVHASDQDERPHKRKREADGEVDAEANVEPSM